MSVLCSTSAYMQLCCCVLLQVRSWLEEHTEAVVMYHPDLAHAAFLLDIPWQQQILQQLFMLLDSKQASIGSHKAGQHFPPGGPCGVQLDMQANGRSRWNGVMPHMPNGAASAPFAPGPGAGAADGPADSSTSCAQEQPEASGGSISTISDSSENSYVSCEDGSTDGGSRGSSPQRYGAAALHTSYAKLPASPFSSFSHTDRMSDRSLDYSTGAGLSAAASDKFASHNSCSSNGNHVLAQYPSRSRDGSLELASSLCMRSWSGVLPCPSVTDASNASESGAPESPRSCNTFVSASSVQSRRSLAATAAAAEAHQAAQLLLQPLLAMQQYGPGQKQHGLAANGKQVHGLGEQPLRRITWGSNASGDLLGSSALQKSADSGMDEVGGAMGGAAGVECLISYRSLGSDTGNGKQQQLQPAAAVLAAAPAPAVPATPPIKQHKARGVVAPLQDGAPPSAVAAAGGRGLLGLKMRPSLGKGPGVPNGVLKRVESLWQGRRARIAARKGSH